jgi:hypothetical protein
MSEDYLRRSQNEVRLKDRLDLVSPSMGVIVIQGFEKRTCGALQVLAEANIKTDRLVIARYVKSNGKFDNVNTRQIEEMAKRVAPGKWDVVANCNDGNWVQQAIKNTGDTILVDITGASSRSMFQILDNLENSGRKIYLLYTEAEQYWPRKLEWDQLQGKLTKHRSIAELVDEKPWMFSYEHHVELVPGHEGFDASGTGRALVAFLSYKCSRLAVILGEEDYAEKIFIAGKPPSPALAWRIGALREINEALTRGSQIVEMDTFGYRTTVRDLAKLLLCDDSLLWKYDVHFAALGSKLQTIGSWIFSRIVPSIIFITSYPSLYYKRAISQGVGTSWIFELLLPSR